MGMGAPTAMSVALGTAYQATDSSRAALIGVIIDLATVINVGAPQSNTVELIVGPTSAVAGGTGLMVDSFSSALTVTLIQLNFSSRNKIWTLLPVGYYFAVRRTVGTGISIVSAFEQAIG